MSENSNALAIFGNRQLAQPGQVDISQEKRDLIKRTICKGASDDELDLFIEQCKRTGLDPFVRQIYSIRRKQWNAQSRSYEEAQVIQVSIDGFRLTAERTGKYAGQVGPWWCGKDGEWKEVWLVDEPPAAAKVGALRTDFQQPLYGIALYKSYVQTNSGGDPVSRWKTDPAGMLAKCAEALSLRRAFPAELSGLYTSEEMDKANDDAVTVPYQEVKAEQPRTNGRQLPAHAPAPAPVSTPEVPEDPPMEGAFIPEQPAAQQPQPPAPKANGNGPAYTGMTAKVGKHQYPAAWARLLAAYTRANQFEVDGILQKLALSQDTKPEDVVTEINAYLDVKEGMAEQPAQQ